MTDITKESDGLPIPAHVERGWKLRDDPEGKRRYSCTVVAPGGQFANAFAELPPRVKPHPVFVRQPVQIVDLGTHYEILVDPKTLKPINA